MKTEGEFLQTASKPKVWERYCGFFDLSIDDFIQIQKHLLLEELNLVAKSALTAKVVNGALPQNIEEFRQVVPLTRYEDYSPYIGNCQEDFLPEKPYFWGRTSGRGGIPKWVPYTPKAIEWLGKFGVALFILATASKKGDIKISNGLRVMQNVPPRPYYTGLCAWLMPQVMELRMIPPPEKYENQPFEKKISDGFNIALQTGIDVLGSLTTILIKMGERFTESSKALRISRNMLHPAVLMRLIPAFIKSRHEKRPILPKDLWPLKGMICFGMDTALYREQLIYYWGKKPLELYGSTEAGLIAVQDWNKKWLTLFPFSNFYEFIPEEEWLKSRENPGYKPATVMLDELRAGGLYELVITSFHGMPFLRYRLGDLIRVADLEDKEAGIKLPQLIFEARADDIIDIGGFTRLDEKTVWQAIMNTGIKFEDWSARKEQNGDKPVLRLYIETRDIIDRDEAEQLIHEQLKVVYADYYNLENMLGIKPLKLTILPKGSFQRYFDAKRKAGADPAHLKPPHMNAPDKDIDLLLNREQKDS
ncbi:MAG: hypothetical protein A2Z02_00075 [Chloroflexi bacterium RBG_16_48_7]|nr:MAG: hypothetical protein A2Z02_00075 [Chloroflexi bacterium RBG_16_48_7]